MFGPVDFCFSIQYIKNKTSIYSPVEKLLTESRSLTINAVGIVACVSAVSRFLIKSWPLIESLKKIARFCMLQNLATIPYFDG